MSVRGCVGIIVSLDCMSLWMSVQVLVGTALSANRTRGLALRGHVCVGGSRAFPSTWR